MPTAPTFPEYMGVAYSDEDYEVDITVSGSGSIAGWTLDANVIDPDGEVVNSGVTVTIVSAVDRTVRLTVVGQDWAGGTAQFTVRRTDVSARTVVYSGYLNVVYVPPA